MLPSTLPSICKSSSLRISPFTTMVAPRHASVRAVGALGRMPGAAFTGAAGVFNSFDGDVPGTSVCESLFHIVPPHSTRYWIRPQWTYLRFTLGGWAEGGYSKMGRHCPRQNLPNRTG